MTTPAPTRAPATMALASFTSSLDRMLIGPLLVLIAADLDNPLVAVAAMAGAYSLTYGLSQPLWGVLSDRYGRVRLLRVTLVLAALASFASALAPNLLVLGIVRAVAGGTYAATVPTTITYVGDTISGTSRQRALADLMTVMAVANAVATAAAGWLGDLVSWRLVFVLPGIIALAAAIGMARVPEPPLPDAAPLRAHLGNILRDRWALLVFGLAFVEGGIITGIITFLAPSLSSRGVDPATAGLAAAAFGVGVLVFSRVVRIATQRMSMTRIMAIGASALVVAYLVVAAHVSIVTVVVCGALLGITWSFLHTSLQTWATNIAPQARGAAVSFFAASLFVGGAVSTATAAPLAQAGSYQLLFAVTAALGVPLGVVAVVGHHRYSRTRG